MTKMPLTDMILVPTDPTTSFDDFNFPIFARYDDEFVPYTQSIIALGRVFSHGCFATVLETLYTYASNRHLVDRLIKASTVAQLIDSTLPVTRRCDALLAELLLAYDASETLQTALHRHDAQTLLQQIGEALLQTHADARLKLLGRLLYHDAETFRHSASVALLSVAFLKNTNLDTADRVAAIGVGALFHDVGKLKICPTLINKPGPLTQHERAKVQLHPELGADFCFSVGFGLQPCTIETVLNHHERFDGTGYPCHLSGTKIPETCRILSIADVFDALASARAYRAALNLDDVFTEMTTRMPGHFDQELLAAFFSCVAAQLPSSSKSVFSL